MDCRPRKTMSQTEQSCVKATTQDRGVLAAGGSASPQDIHRLPGATTLEYSKGREFQKRVVFANQAKARFQFLQSGLPATMEDRKVSLAMMETALPFIENGTASFAFIFNKELTVETSCFEKNCHFENIRKCGKGVSGEVEAFRDTRSQSQLSFVRKRFKKGSCMRKEEVQSLLKLSHPGVVQVYALLCANTTVDLILQDAGHPLRECLKIFCDKKISAAWYWQVVKDLAKQGFEALRYIHQHGICHLDIKPENLLVHQARNKSLVLVVADFGSSVSLTGTMTFNLGLTPEYWAPELWHHVESHLHKLVMSRSGEAGRYEFAPQCSFDTYAMGLCVYYMASLQHLVKQLETQQKTDNPLVKHGDIQHACQQFGSQNSDFVFKLLLMKQFSYQLPHWATTSDSWLFPGISASLLTLIGNTLHPDPQQRWTDGQVLHFLSGEAEVCQARKDEPELKTPTPVEDTSPYCAGHGQSEQDKPQPLPEHKNGQWAPVLADPTDISVRQVEQPEGLRSVGIQRFHQNIAPHMKCWDLNQVTADPSQATSQVKQPVITNIAMVTTTHDDAVISLESRTNVPAAQQTSGKKILSLRALGSIATDLSECADADLEMNESACKKFEEPKPQIVAVDGAGLGEGKSWGKEFEGGFLESKGRGEKTHDCSVINVTGNLEVLNMHCKAESINTAPIKSPSALGWKGKTGGKGKAGGKGKGKRMPVKLGRKGEGHREEVGKVMASSAITKARSPEKAVLHGKSLPLVSEQLKQTVPEIPFVVASSSRPKPRSRMMSGLPMTCADPRTCSHSGGGVSVVKQGSSVLVRPPDAIAECELGWDDGILASRGEACLQPHRNDLMFKLSPPYVEDIQHVPVPGSGNQNRMPAVVSQPQQPGLLVPSMVSPVVSADPIPMCLAATVGHDLAAPVPCLTEPQSAPSGFQLEPEVMDYAGVEELLKLLEAETFLEQLQTPVADSLGAEMQVQISPEGGPPQPGHTSLIDTVYVADMIPVSDEYMTDMNESMFMGSEQIANMDEVDTQGNVPDFDQLF